MNKRDLFLKDFKKLLNDKKYQDVKIFCDMSIQRLCLGSAHCLHLKNEVDFIFCLSFEEILYQLEKKKPKNKFMLVVAGTSFGSVVYEEKFIEILKQFEYISIVACSSFNGGYCGIITKKANKHLTN